VLIAKPHTIGVLLAGGKSSRMGENKAFLELQGEKFIDRMIRILLETGVDDVFVSGDFGKYQCIPDKISNEFERPCSSNLSLS
jgi:molybdopterin-guanine dinucleotide biosynthesis protein A